MPESPLESSDLEKRASLETELLERRKRAIAGTLIPKADPARPVPLSPAQHRIWFSEKSQEQRIFNVVQAVRLSGKLDPASLGRAFDDVVARHEPLRSVITLEQGVARVSPSPKVPRLVIERIDRNADGESRIERLVEETAELPFDLASQPPMRARLLQLDDEDFLFVVVIHHIACDEWSVRIFNAEIDAFYKAHVRGVPADMPKLKIGYSDFATWQHAELANGRWDASLGYWRSQLQGADSQFTLPAARNRAAASRGALGELSFSLNPQTSNALDAIGRECGATPFMTMLAITMATLHGRSGERDIAIATQMAGRNRPELANLIGVFTNTVVMRTRYETDPPFMEFLAGVREQVIASLSHGDYPFDMLVRKMPELRSKSGKMPFGQIMFTHRQQFRPTLHGAGINSSPVKYARENAKFDLWIAIVDEGELRTVRLHNDTALLEATALEAFAEDFRNVAAAIIKDRNTRLWQLPVRRESPEHDANTAVAKHDPLLPVQRDENLCAIEDRLINICGSVLKGRAIDRNASFFDIGGDSLSILEFLFKTEEAFGVDLAMSDVFREPTITAIARYIVDTRSIPGKLMKKTRGEDRLVTPLLPSGYSAGHARNFFLIPGAGGIPLRFSSVARRMVDRWYGLGVVHPEMVPGEPKPDSVHAIASRMKESIERVDPNGPYLLVGYSYGGFVAYEIARQLSDSGKIVGVVILDTRLRLNNRIQRLQKRARIILKKADLVTMAVRTLRKLKTQIRYSRLTAMGKLEADPGKALLAKRKPGPWHALMMNSQRLLLRKYKPASSLVPIVLIRASRSVRESDYPDYGWSMISNVVAVMQTGGNHMTFFEGENEEPFAACFDEALNRLSLSLVR
jgi:thioesterase domain-containing protein/acyl carrier protein